MQHDPILDAMDELSRARDLARLIALTTQSKPDHDQQAIAAGCEAIKARFEAAFHFLEQAKEET